MTTLERPFDSCRLRRAQQDSGDVQLDSWANAGLTPRRNCVHPAEQGRTGSPRKIAKPLFQRVSPFFIWADLNSWAAQAACGFDSRPRHQNVKESRVLGPTVRGSRR